MPEGLTTGDDVAEVWRRDWIRVRSVEYDLMGAKAKLRGPRGRGREYSLIWTARPYSSADPDTRQGDLLLTPSGPLFGFGRVSRALGRRSVDDAYDWRARHEPALDVDGMLVETGAPGQWANAFLRSTFDAGLIGWTSTAPGAATIAAESIVTHRYFSSDVTGYHILMTQADPAVADVYLSQNFAAIAAWVGVDIGPRVFGVAARCETGTEELSLVVRRSSDNFYYDWVAGNWQAALDADCYWSFTPSTGAPSYHWTTVDLGTVAAGETYTPRIVQRAGIAGGAQHQVFYAQFGGAYQMSPVYNGAAYGEGRRWDNLWIPNYVGARCFPADHHTLSIWVKPWWNLDDDLESPGMVALGLQQHFGLFCCWHDSDNYVECHVDQPDAELKFLWRAGGTDYPITVALTTFGRDQWQNVTVRKTGTAGEHGQTAHTVDLFLGGVLVGSVEADALVEDDHSIFIPGAGHDYAFGAAPSVSGFPLPLNGWFSDLMIANDCKTDEEIAMMVATTNR
jgi:hypothetical protein